MAEKMVYRVKCPVVFLSLISILCKEKYLFRLRSENHRDFIESIFSAEKQLRGLRGPDMDFLCGEEIIEIEFHGQQQVDLFNEAVLYLKGVHYTFAHKIEIICDGDGEKGGDGNG